MAKPSLRQLKIIMNEVKELVKLVDFISLSFLKNKKNEKPQKTANPGKTDNHKGVKRQSQSTPEDMHRTNIEICKNLQIRLST